MVREYHLATNMAAIAAATMKEIASKWRNEGCLLLAKQLGWEDAFSEDASQHIMTVDYLYDALMFSVKKGLPWGQVSTAYSLAYDMISATKDKSISDAIRIYKKSCEECRNKISPQNLKVFTNYFFETFFAHYNLYQYVFNRPQEQQVVNVALEVETMPEVHEFSDAEEVSIYQYEKKLADIDKLNEARKMEREQTTLMTKNQCEEEVNSVMGMIENQCLSDKEKLAELIHTVAAAHMSAASHTLTNTMDGTMEDLDHALQRTALPRPAELGTPPRMLTKKACSAAQKRQKSPTRAKSGKSRVASAKKGKCK